MSVEPVHATVAPPDVCSKGYFDHILPGDTSSIGKQTNNYQYDTLVEYIKAIWLSIEFKRKYLIYIVLKLIHIGLTIFRYSK